MKRFFARLPFVAGVALLVLLPQGTAAPLMAYGSCGMARVSVSSDGTQAAGGSSPAISTNGRYVALNTLASNLVPDDTNGFTDVFVRDVQMGITTRVSVASDGTQGNSEGRDRPSISADGRYVAFNSYASNLVSGDTNSASDVFVHDNQTGVTTRVSVASDGTQGNRWSGVPAISADGRYVAFSSSAINLVPGDTNAANDVFVHDMQTGQTTRVSVASDGSQENGFNGGLWPAISADGRYVAFQSDATNLVPSDTNGVTDVFVHDMQTGQTTRVSVASDGTQANGMSDAPAVSADGRYVAFDSGATNLVPGNTRGGVFVHDMQTGRTTIASVASNGVQGNAGGAPSAISADGRFVAFYSTSTNLVPGDTNDLGDMFVHDMQTGWTTRASVACDGTQANGQGNGVSISGDGRYVAFDSSASNLVAGDTSGIGGVFLRDLGSGPLTSLYLPLVVQGASGGW